MSEPNEPKKPVTDSLTDFATTLGTPEHHQELSVSYLIAEALDADREERTGNVILPAFMHGMLAGLKIAGK